MPEGASVPLAADAAAGPQPLLQQRPFRMWCYTRFATRVAQNSLNFALVLLIVDETGLAVMSSLLVLMLVIPSTFAGIVAGVTSDVFPKRLQMVVACLARALVCVWFARGETDVTSMLLVAFVLASLTPFATVPEGALQPLIVDRSQLAKANAISQAVGSGAQLVGLGVLTPFVLRLLNSPDLVFYIAAVLYTVAAGTSIAIGRARRAPKPEVGTLPGRTEGPWWSVGWRTMRADRMVWHAAIELSLLSTTLIILGGLIPSYITETLNLPVEIGAVVLFPAAIGIVLGLRIAGFLVRKVPHTLLSSVGFAGFVVLLALLAFVDPAARFLSGYGAFAWLNTVNIGDFDRGGVLAMLIMAPLGFSFAVATVAGQTVINDLVPLHLQGRVQSTQAAMAGLASSAPVLAAGAMADLVGVNAVIAVVAALIGIAAVMNLRGRRERAAPALDVVGRID